LQQAYSMAFDAAKFVEREQAFANLAASHGENSQKIIDGLKRMSGQTLDTMTIMEKAGTARHDAGYPRREADRADADRPGHGQGHRPGGEPGL
jgi:hypothetical protein